MFPIHHTCETGDGDDILNIVVQSSDKGVERGMGAGASISGMDGQDVVLDGEMNEGERMDGDDETQRSGDMHKERRWLRAWY